MTKRAQQPSTPALSVVSSSKKTKPPYRVPTMSEIEALPKNKLRVVSLFSGCGGSSLGYKMAGYDVAAACEFVEAARDCYAANFPKTPIYPGDVRALEPAELMRIAGVKEGGLDVLDGSPPCASFSLAGKREKGWGKIKKYSDVEQRSDDLFFEYARIIRGVRPRAFVAENVAGLVVGSAKGYFKAILRELKTCGYRVEARVLDASWLGVPQSRRRVIFIGIREDLKSDPVYPKPLPYRYSLRDALPWIQRVKRLRDFQRSTQRSADLPVAALQALGMDGVARHQLAVVTGTSVEEAEELCRAFGRNAVAKEWDKLLPGGQSEKYFQLVRPSPDEPCPTVTAAGGNPGLASVTHPLERRKFSIAELRRICAFPDDFILTGTYAQQWERLGRAVPPLMMRAVALELATVLVAKNG